MSRSSLEYKNSARSSALHYFLVIFGGGFAFFAASTLSVTGECLEFLCQQRLAWLALILGALFGLGGLYALIFNWQWGSRIDFSTNELIWWEGYPPVQVHRIALGRIATIVIDDSFENRRIFLLDDREEPLKFSSQCVPANDSEWARKIQEAYPHIQIIEK